MDRYDGIAGATEWAQRFAAARYALDNAATTELVKLSPFSKAEVYVLIASFTGLTARAVEEEHGDQASAFVGAQVKECLPRRRQRYGEVLTHVVLSGDLEALRELELPDGVDLNARFAWLFDVSLHVAHTLDRVDVLMAGAVRAISDARIEWARSWAAAMYAGDDDVKATTTAASPLTVADTAALMLLFAAVTKKYAWAAMGDETPVFVATKISERLSADKRSQYGETLLRGFVDDDMMSLGALAIPFWAASKMVFDVSLHIANHLGVTDAAIREVVQALHDAPPGWHRTPAN